MRAAEEWYRAHLAEQPAIATVARASGVSAAHLRRLYQRTGRGSPKTAFNRVRLARAAELLAQSDLKLAAVASECGFSSLSHFCQAFKSLHGTTPHAWRRYPYQPYRHPADPLTLATGRVGCRPD